MIVKICKNMNGTLWNFFDFPKKIINEERNLNITVNLFPMSASKEASLRLPMKAILKRTVVA